jgi:hypothetical protein
MRHGPGKKAGKRQLVAVLSRPFSFQAKPYRNNGAERQKGKKSLIIFIEKRTHTKAGRKKFSFLFDLTLFRKEQ